MPILTGALHPNWRGGVKRERGYILRHSPAHQKANSQGYVREHVLVVESVMGKPLRSGAVPHHLNGIKSDNRHENLVVCQDSAYHMLLHQRQRARMVCGHAGWLKCPYCKQYDDPANLYIPPVNGPRRSPRHRVCFNDHQNLQYKNGKRRRGRRA